MKKAKWLLLLTSFIFTAIACRKNNSIVTKIETSKNVLGVGESLTVQISNPQAGSISRWTVQPAPGSSVDNLYTTGNNTMKFTQAGTYVINADMRTIHPDCRPSPSWDTCFFNAAESVKLATTVTVK